MISFIQSVWTVLAFVIFIGIVVWAWNSRRKEDFDKAARMPLDDDDPIDEHQTKH